MGKKTEGNKKNRKYFTLMETVWKIGAPIIVAVGKTVIENNLPKIPMLFK